jgi:uncharacterized protein DUF547
MIMNADSTFLSRTAGRVMATLLVVSLAAVGQASAEDITKTFKTHAAASTQTVDHGEWDRLLGKYVTASQDGVNRVDYVAWKANDHAPLKAYVKRLENTDPRKLGRSEQFAYWANLYNAKTIDVLLDHYPVESIREITINEGLLGFLKKSVGAGGPWKAKIITVIGQQLSLDDVEHEIMRPIFKDPRVHYAVNCASYGCPNLGREAFTGAKLDGQLDANAKAFINHPRGIDVQGGSVKASSIYQWFQSDFGGTQAGVLDHVRKYAGDNLNSKLKGKKSIGSYDYDWSLNSIQRGS